jgi:hypothetical protein
MRWQLQDIERLHLGLIGAAVCAAALVGWLSAASLLLGGAVMAANVWLMRQLTDRLLVRAAGRPGMVVALVLAKFSLFIGLLMLLFWRVPLDAVAFGIGASLLLVATVVTALRPQRAAATT